MNSPTRVFIGLGCNLGNKEENLSNALVAIEESPHLSVERVSSLYLTEPVGYLEQDEFINAVAEINTGLQPEELLSLLQEIEIAQGRVRLIRWGPRTIDLDILLYGDQIISTPRLIVPHPRVIERAFVLKPLAELEPELVIAGRKIGYWLDQVSEQKISLFKHDWFVKLS